MSAHMPSPLRPLRGAIVGFGNVAARAHLPVWREHRRFTIEAVVEPAPERAELAGRMLPGARIYPSLDDMLAESRLDFVDICTPPGFHCAQVLAALGCGLHVFCEKPLAVRPVDLRAIRAAAERAQKVVFTVNNWKYAPLWVTATALVRGGAIGAVRAVALNVLRCTPSGGGASDWRTCAETAQGGIVVDHGWHTIYLLLSLVPEAPLSVAATLTKPAEPAGLEQTADVLIRFGRADARLHLTWQAACRRNFGTITGDEGTIYINDDHLVLQADGRPPARIDFAAALSAGSHHPEWMKPVIEDFRREIHETGRRGNNLAEACRCASLIHSAYCSAQDACEPVAPGWPEQEPGIDTQRSAAESGPPALND